MMLAEQSVVSPPSTITVSRGVTLDQLDGWKVAEVAIALFLGLFSYFARSYLREFKTLQQEAVRKEAFDKAINEIKTERRTMHEENKDILARIEGKIDVAAQATLIEQVRTLSAGLGKLDVYTVELKHNHIDPYTRAVDVLKSRVDEMDKRAHK